MVMLFHREQPREHWEVREMEKAVASSKCLHEWLALGYVYAKHGLMDESAYARELYDISVSEERRGLARKFAPVSCEYRSAMILLEKHAGDDNPNKEALCRVAGVTVDHLRLVHKGIADSIESHMYREAHGFEADELQAVLGGAVRTEPSEMKEYRDIARGPDTGGHAPKESGADSTA